MAKEKRKPTLVETFTFERAGKNVLIFARDEDSESGVNTGKMYLDKATFKSEKDWPDEITVTVTW